MEQEFHNCLKLLLVLINDLYSVFAKTNVLAIVAIMVSAFTVYPAFALGTPTTADLFYTTFSGTPNVHKVHASWDGTTFSLGAPTDLASTEGADGIIFAPDGDLLVAGQNLGTINKVHLSPLSITIKSAGSGTPATSAPRPANRRCTSSATGRPRNGAAALDTLSGALTDWNAQLDGADPGGTATVYALTHADG